jgi:uncharacterized protein DUF3618
MDQEPRKAEPGVAEGERTPEQIQAEIDATREELGETAAAVAEKADVKGQARQRVDAAKQNVQAKRDELLGRAKAGTPDSASAGMQQVSAKARENPLPLAVAGALVVGFLFGRRRSDR